MAWVLSRSSTIPSDRFSFPSICPPYAGHIPCEDRKKPVFPADAGETLPFLVVKDAHSLMAVYYQEADEKHSGQRALSMASGL